MSAHDSLVRLKQINQPEVSGYILAVVLPYIQTGIAANNTGVLTGVFYPLKSNPSGYLTNNSVTGFATLQNLSGTANAIYSYIAAYSYPLTNPSGFITTGQTGSFAGNTGGFVTTGQTGQFYPSSNPSGFITSAQAGGVQSISVTGHNLSGVLTFSGLGGLTLLSSGQIVYFSGAANLDPNKVVLTTGNQTVSGNKTFVGSRTTILHGSGSDFILDNIKNSSNKTIIGVLGKVINDGGTFNNTSIDFGNRSLWDSNGFLVADWQVRQLYDNFAGYSLDWKVRQLIDSNGNLVLDWEQHSLTGAIWTYSGKPITTGGPYYPFTGNPAGYLTTGSSFYPLTGNPSGYLEATGTSVRHVSANVQFDGTLIVSGVLDSSTKTLKDNAHVLSADWTNRFMYDNVGASSLAWGTRQLVGSWLAPNFGLFDVPYNFYALKFDSNTNWYLQSLYPNGNAKIQFYDSTSSGTMPYISGFNLVNCVGITGTINPSQVVFTTGNQNISGNKTFGNQSTFNGGIATQIITGTISNTPSIDIHSGLLYNASKQTSVDWKNRILSGVSGNNFSWESGIFYGINAFGTPLKTIDMASFALFDKGVAQSIDWNFRNLFNSAGNLVIDWENGTLADYTSNVSIDYINRTLNDAGSHIIVDWANSFLNDLTGTNSVDWHNRILFNSSQVRSLDWQNRLMSGDWQVNGSFFGGGGSTSGISGSLAFGNGARARSKSTIALVQDADAFANWAVAIGFGASAGGTSSFAFGEDAAAGGGYGCMAYGAGANAIGDYSMAFGRGAISQNAYSFVIGMEDLPTIQDTAVNQFVAKFTGGIIFTGSAVQAPDFHISGRSVHHGDIIFDTSNMESISLADRQLIYNGNAAVDWAVGAARDPIGILSIQWNDADRKLYDNGELISADWNNRLLYDNTNVGGDFGTGESLDWGSRLLVDSGHHVTLDWQKKILSGTWNAQNLLINGGPITGSAANTGQLTGVFYPLNSNPSGYATTGNYVDVIGTGNITIITGSGVIYISGTNSATNTGILTGVFYPYSSNPSGYITYTGAQRILFAPSSVSGSGYIMDFVNGSIYHTNTQPLIDLAGNQIYNTGGNLTIDWNNNILQRDDGETSINWKFNTLQDNGSAITLDWQKKILSGSWQAGDVLVSGVSIGPEGIRIFKSNKINFKTTGNYNLFTVPSGFLFNIDTMEVITTDITSPSAAPFIQFGNTSNSSAYQNSNQTISNSQFSRHIYDNPQDSVNTGVTLTATIGTASTAVMHSGFLIYKGYLIRNL